MPRKTLLGIVATTVTASFLVTATSASEARLVGSPRFEQRESVRAEEAAALSLRPTKQLVFHYNENVSDLCKHAIASQAERLRLEGYLALAIAGATEEGLRIYIAGKTANELLFNEEQIIHMLPLSYSYKAYKLLLGDRNSNR